MKERERDVEEEKGVRNEYRLREIREIDERSERKS